MGETNAFRDELWNWRLESDIESELRAKDPKTAREELMLDLFGSRPNKIWNWDADAGIPVSTRKQGDRVLILYPDGPQHEARATSLALNAFDRVFWVNLIIACDGPASEKHETKRTALVKRDFGKLENAVNDLDAFVRYYMPMRLGHPGLIYHAKVGRSPGYFDITKRLCNPGIVDIKNTINELRQWISVNSTDPEFKSVQINIMFAGHGYSDSEGESGIVIADGPLSSKNLGAMILDIIPEWDEPSSPSRLDMYLDCCHSAAVARDLLEEVMSIQELQPAAFASKSRLGFGKFFCSCMDDESSLELTELRHGLFSFAFLNEFSRRPPDGADDINIALRDIGWFSEMQQHPFLVDFTEKEQRFSLMFPSAKLGEPDDFAALTEHALSNAFQHIVNEKSPVNGKIVVSPFTMIVRALHELRAAFLDREVAIFNNPSSRKFFSRDEFFSREKMWH
jgi:hypothetical protein